MLERGVVADADLLQRVIQHDSMALIELERRHSPSLYAQAYGILMDSALADGVVREVFAQLWFAARRSVVKGSLWAWLRDLVKDLARAELSLQKRCEVQYSKRPEGASMKRIGSIIPGLLLVPALAVAQNPPTANPNVHAADIAKAKVADAMTHRATHVRGQALDNQPLTPPSVTPATHATPSGRNPDGGAAKPAIPATPAIPSPHSQRPDHAGQGGQGRGNNPRRP